MGKIGATAAPTRSELPDSPFRNLEPSELEFQRELTRTLTADLVERTESSAPVGTKNDPAQTCRLPCRWPFLIARLLPGRFENVSHRKRERQRCRWYSA